MANILVVDDEKRIRHLLSIMLERAGHQVVQAGDGIEALQMLEKAAFDIVITDIRMPKMSGMELLKKIKSAGLACPVIFITAHATIDSAVEIMRLGAADYITKPFEEDRILLTIERSLNISRVMAENKELRKELIKSSGHDKIICASKAMKQMLAVASKVAKSDSAVLISGESGTGKELLARFIHFMSNRKNGRFVPINCAAISPQLVESELFGYEKGAFSGADKRTEGKFEYANNGTLFLDEIGDLSLDAQAKLLRALQEKKIRRVGGNQELGVNVRVVCASNRNLHELVETGQFRQDLLFRINVFPLESPPLRERKEDIIPLCRHFLERLSGMKSVGLSDSAVRLLTDYPWPGNVRELANAMERALILSPDPGGLTAESLSFLKSGGQSENRNGNGFKLPPGGISLETVQKNLVRQALEISGNNQSNAAQLLGLTRAKFRILMKHAID
ncbi:MAG: sigma-54 dependent transcriptional regulator [Desulfobacterales bacterium]|jgi:DNA-binding NtrC family response regulator|nr:sigma-54 dependent transcriptional regulator [Desulfobacterales bacterium]